MQERVLQAPPPCKAGDGFQFRSPQAVGRTRLYCYVVVMDGVRYHIALRNSLSRANKQASLIHMAEGDFSEVSREGRAIFPEVFLSAYSRFFRLADSEPAHTIEIYYSLASL